MSRRPRELTASAAAPVFAALGDATRLSLLNRLCDGQPRSISELTAGTKLTRQGVTKHLGVLERAKLVKHERIGRETRYAVEPATLTRARDYLDRASRQWDEAIARLRRFVEE